MLDAVVECLAEMPYTDVSAARISERSGVSRGGVQYHYPTRQELFLATIDHLYERRLKAYAERLKAIPAGVDMIDYLIDSQWRYFHERDFQAYMELVLAARAEPDLRTAMGPDYRAFLQQWYDVSLTAFGWDNALPDVRRIGNVIQYTMEGMAYGELANQLEPTEVEDTLAYLKEMLRVGLRVSQGT